MKYPYKKLKHIHMVGIGGTGMNGIAEVLINLGYKVSGTDLRQNEATQRLASLGAAISIGHEAEKVRGADVVVISSAVKEENVELQEAKKQKIPIIPRAEMLAELMRLKNGIAVAGSHGKTSTTSMIAEVLESGGFDPTIIVGGRLNTIGAHAKLGDGDYFVAEADESDRSFLYLSPFIAVLTNLDKEHLEQYETIGEIKKTFIHFANKVPFYCPVILCLDDPNLQSLIPEIERRIISYGFSEEAAISAKHARFHKNRSISSVYYQGKEMGELNLNVPGAHNILNAMAAVAVGLDLEIPEPTIFQALENYTGIGRRFEFKAEISDITIIEDYAHHPTEITATLNAAKEGWDNRRVVVIFQPHRYSRLSLLMKSFAESFNKADVVFITEVFPAGEKPIPKITGKALAKGIGKSGQKNVFFEPDLQKAPEKIAEIAQPGDMIFVMGAGSINKIVPAIIQHLEKKG